MLDEYDGKLFVYASRFICRGRRLGPVKTAAERLAKYLKLGFEVKTFSKKFEPIYVYYKNGDDEPIPIYCVNEGQSSIEEVGAALRNMMFVLSFHPKHLALRQVRKEIMLFS